MRLATAQQAREIDELSVSAYGLTGDILMESAGTLAAREIQLNFFPELGRGQVAVVCGPGNNGGDGLVVARHLHAMGFRDLAVYVLAPPNKQSELFKLQLRRAELHGLRVHSLHRAMKKAEALRSVTLVVDAIFGHGLKTEVQGDYASLIEIINSLKVPKVSVDLPSGLDPDRGVVLGVAVRADMTLSFGLAKPGFYVGDGPRHVGKLRVLPIGFPFECLRSVAVSHFVFNERLAKRYLPHRGDRDNKFHHGRLVVCAGSEGKWGAGILASHAAYRMGSGYVYWTSFESPLENLKSIPEVLTTDLDSEDLWDTKKVSSWVVGPGLGVNEKVRDLILRLREANFPKVVLDADALTVAVKYQLFPLPATWVLTPHSGELSRIIKKSAEEIEADRYGAAIAAAKITGCHVLLKGFRSILSYQGRCMVINAGNSALAKAGTGDVLAGMIGSLLAQGLDTLPATATAAFIHGKLADDWLRRGLHRSSLLASDIHDELPALLSRLSNSTVF